MASLALRLPPPEAWDHSEYERPRPRTRGDCVGHELQCPFVSCKYHLYLDVSPATGSVKLNFPDLEPDQLEHSCVLAIADRGGAMLEDVGEVMNVTREMIRQIEAKAVRRIMCGRTAFGLSDFDEPGARTQKRRLPLAGRSSQR